MEIIMGVLIGVHIFINVIVLIAIIQDDDFSDFVDMTLEELFKELDETIELQHIFIGWLCIYVILIILFCKVFRKVGKITIYKPKKKEK